MISMYMMYCCRNSLTYCLLSMDTSCLQSLHFVISSTEALTAAATIALSIFRVNFQLWNFLQNLYKRRYRVMDTSQKLPEEIHETQTDLQSITAEYGKHVLYYALRCGVG